MREMWFRVSPLTGLNDSFDVRKVRARARASGRVRLAQRAEGVLGTTLCGVR
jgi:hypothetical protein